MSGGPARPPVPEGLVEAFWEYERALMSDDLPTLDRLFAPGPTTLRGDANGLLVGHDQIVRRNAWYRGLLNDCKTDLAKHPQIITMAEPVDVLLPAVERPPVHMRR